MKRILTVLFALAMLIPMSARAEEFILGNCNHKIATGTGSGNGSAGVISAAMYVPAMKLKTLAGNTIDRVDVGLISRINVKNMNVWVRKSLDGENLAVETIEKPAVNWNTAKFSNPYVIEENCPGLYIGFDYENGGTSNAVSFTGESGDYQFFFRPNTNTPWQDLTTRGALSLEAYVVGDNLPQYDIALTSASISPNPAAGEFGYTVGGNVSNLALRDLTGFTVAISQNDQFAGSAYVALDLPQGKSGAFSTTIQADRKLEGTITIAITSLNDGQDANMDNNRKNAKLSFLRNVVVEEFTTENCPNCPQAAGWYHEVLEENLTYHSRVVPVCHHSAFGTDWLTRDCDEELLWLFGPEGQVFAPSAMFDRNAMFQKGLAQDKKEPIVGLRSKSDFTYCIEECMKIPTHAMLGISIVEDRGTEIEVKVSGITDNQFNLKNPILVFYAMEDNVKAVKQQSSSAGALADYYHAHVIRFDNGSYGEELSISNNAFEKTYVVPMDNISVKNNLYFGAFIANKNLDDINDNAIENGAVFYMKDIPAGVETIGDAQEVVEVARYDINGLRLTAPAQGLNIVVFSDGSVKKVFINK